MAAHRWWKRSVLLAMIPLLAASAVFLECPLASHDGDFIGIPNLELIHAPS